MLTVILIFSVLSFLLGFYNLMVSNNGFTITNRNIKLGSAKSEVLTKKCDEIVGKYNGLTKGLAEQLK